MRDYLKELCKKENIRLVYTNNKRLLLSSSINKDNITIRSHISFKFCPENVAEAIVKYYYSTRKNEKYINIIETYIRTALKINDYFVKPPSQSETSNTKAQDKQNKNEILYKEMKILKIDKRNFWGGTVNLSENESFEADSEDVVELNIIVAPLDT